MYFISSGLARPSQYPLIALKFFNFLSRFHCWIVEIINSFRQGSKASGAIRRVGQAFPSAYAFQGDCQCSRDVSSPFINSSTVEFSGPRSRGGRADNLGCDLVNASARTSVRQKEGEGSKSPLRCIRPPHGVIVEHGTVTKTSILRGLSAIKTS